MPSVINGFYSMLQIVFSSIHSFNLYANFSLTPLGTDGNIGDFKHGMKAIIGGMASQGFPVGNY